MDEGTVDFLKPCLALSPLDRQTIFGKSYQFRWVAPHGKLSYSEEKVNLTIGPETFSLCLLNIPVIKSHVFLPFPPSDNDITDSLVACGISGPESTIERQLVISAIRPMLWTASAKGSAYQIKLSHSKLSITFHQLKEKQMSVNGIWIILPESFASIFDATISVDLQAEIPIQNEQLLTFSRIITESDIRNAQMNKKKIRLTSTSRLTPSARELGKSFQIFID